jgi:hypothetical protein
VPFERYADDVIVHCRTEQQAQEIRQAIAERLRGCGLELHPEKTKIVYCKDEDRKGNYQNEKFDFLGFTFRPRGSKNRYGKLFINFSPATPTKRRKPSGTRFVAGGCPSAATKQSKICPACSIRSSEAGSNITGDTIARRYYRRGVDWIETWPYGPSENTRSYGIITGGLDTGSRASHCVSQSSLPIGRWEHAAGLFDGSCMSREAHVQFCEGLGVRLPGATHLLIHANERRRELRKKSKKK